MRFENSQEKYTKAAAENTRKKIDSLEIELQHLKADLKNYQTSQKHPHCKSNLVEIYSKKANGVRIRSECRWYKSDEKSKNFLLNLEKPCVSQGLIRTLVINKNEINDPIETNTEFQDFHKTLFIDNLSISKKEKKQRKKSGFCFRRLASAKTSGRASYKM